MATISQSTVAKGSDSVIDFCCSPCLGHNIDQLAEFYCKNCNKFYCGKCSNQHGQLFGKHVTYGRGDTSEWPMSKEVEDFIKKCDLHEDKCLEMFCYDHSQLCCTYCAFINHRQCAKVTLISESIKGATPNFFDITINIEAILESLKKLENKWNFNMQSLQDSYDEQLHEIHKTRQEINTILDEIEKTTIKELDAEMTLLKASFKTDLDNCCKLKNELKQLIDATHEIVDKGTAELSFIASKKCLEQLNKSETYLRENKVQVESYLTFEADINIEQFFSTLSCLGRIVVGDPLHVFTLHKKSEYDVRIPSDSSSCDIRTLCVLSNDQVLVADGGNKRVKLLDLQYKVVGHCDLTYYPYDMCVITPSEVAVAVDEKETHEVQFVSVNGGQLVKGRKLQFQHECKGIAHNQKDLYLTSRTALYKYSMSGDLYNKLYEDTTSDNTVFSCAVSLTGHIFVITGIHHKVLILARDGILLSTFTHHDLEDPFGIHVTNQGSVLVCGGASNTLLQLDGEGRQKLATLATKRDGLDVPVSVCYNSSTASIIVAQAERNKILVFKNAGLQHL